VTGKNGGVLANNRLSQRVPLREAAPDLPSRAGERCDRAALVHDQASEEVDNPADRSNAVIFCSKPSSSTKYRCLYPVKSLLLCAFAVTILNHTQVCAERRFVVDSTGEKPISIVACISKFMHRTNVIAHLNKNAISVRIAGCCHFSQECDAVGRRQLGSLSMDRVRPMARHSIRSSVTANELSRSSQTIPDPAHLSYQSPSARSRGKKFIRQIVEISHHPQLFGKVVFLLNYATNVPRFMISGSNPWLNTPR